MATEPPVWEELFHQCALTAYVEVARAEGGRPESAAVRRRAYALYEAELRARSDLTLADPIPPDPVA